MAFPLIRLCIEWTGELLENTEPLVEQLGENLVLAGKTLAIAESCTGGALSAVLTDVAGSSRYFIGGLVVYSNSAKTRFLHISHDLLEEHGAVSYETAYGMAESVRLEFGSSIGLSITGIAGPGGGTPEKPVGLVFMGLSDEQRTTVLEFHFTGSRQVIRKSATIQALLMVAKRLEDYALT
jgi:PncC family amidohydrolase